MEKGERERMHKNEHEKVPVRRSMCQCMKSEKRREREKEARHKDKKCEKVCALEEERGVCTAAIGEKDMRHEMQRDGEEV